ncbi:glycosyltransferase [Natrononativus amylolyticus]|uniref:glycosyltransferase n=1 Tax=Natrononativus amylolyticus TaxID=2963434 RepID=UPI0020CF5586|nr:glycosyltransferase [Natrononativus amylolyticus]
MSDPVEGHRERPPAPGESPPRVLFVLAVIRHTTYAYELAERIDERTPVDVTVVSYEDRSVDDLEVQIPDGLEVVTLGARSRFDPRAIRRLRELLSDPRFDLIHTHHNFVGSLARALAPRGKPLVDTQHADHRGHYSLVQNVVNAATLPRADRIVVNSAATGRSFYPLERRLLSADRVGVIYNGIDLGRLDAALADGGDGVSGRNGDRRVVAVGRMIGTKNFETLIRAVATLEDPSVHLTLVGDGPRRAALESLAADLGVADRTTFTGTVPREAVYRTVAASDLFVLPSRSEGFCVAAVEAMACGVPVVVSDIPVLREVVGDAGSYADPDDPAAFADRMRDLLENDDARLDAGRRARRRARARFSLDRAADLHARLYRRLLE